MFLWLFVCSSEQFFDTEPHPLDCFFPFPRFPKKKKTRGRKTYSHCFLQKLFFSLYFQPALSTLFLLFKYFHSDDTTAQSVVIVGRMVAHFSVFPANKPRCGFLSSDALTWCFVTRAQTVFLLYILLKSLVPLVLRQASICPWYVKSKMVDVAMTESLRPHFVTISF